MTTRCDWSDLPTDQCACVDHGNVNLPPGIEPQVRRGVQPHGLRVWPPREPQHEPKATRDRHKAPKPLTDCRWTSDGWVTREHVRDCTTNTCEGCKPCPKTHCALRGRCANHVNVAVGEFTCPQCIGKTRGRLDQIEDILALLPEEAQDAGVDSEALNLIGPAAAPEQVDARRRLEDSHRGFCHYPRELSDEHPYRVLGDWDMALRETYGPKTDLFVTVSRAADYLRGLLAGPFPHTHEFERFDADIAKCLTHLEEVYHDSRKPETGAPCPKCADDPEKTRKAPRLVKHHDQADRSGASDKWTCPDNPAHWWKEADYRLRVKGDFLTRADRLTADQMREAYGITPGTLRKWAEREQVGKRGRDGNGRLMYDVAQARRRHDLTRGWCDFPRAVSVYPHVELEDASA